MQKSLKKIVSTLWVSIAFTAFVSLWAQSSSNPFEIKPRLKQLKETEINKVGENAQTNEAEIDIIGVDSLADEKKIATNLDTTLISNDETKNIVNPFDVDHVPLRKNIDQKRRPNQANYSKTDRNNHNFIFWYLLLGTIILAIVINTNFKTLSLAWKSIGNENILKLFLREQVDGLSSSIILLYCNFFISFSVFIYLILTFKFKEIVHVPYLYILLFIIGFYLLKHLSLFIIGWLYKIEKDTTIYSFTIMVSNLFIGVLFLPCNFILAFSPEPFRNIVLILMLVLLGIIIVIRSFRALLIVSDKIIIHFFQIFIYLCAFEIAPIVLLAKFLMKNQV